MKQTKELINYVMFTYYLMFGNYIYTICDTGFNFI